MRITEMNYSPAQIDIVFAALVAQICDIHAPVWNLDDDQLEQAAQMLESLTDTSDPLAYVISAALAYAAHDIDHAGMSEAQIAAGEQALPTSPRSTRAVPRHDQQRLSKRVN